MFRLRLVYLDVKRTIVDKNTSSCTRYITQLLKDTIDRTDTNNRYHRKDIFTTDTIDKTGTNNKLV